MFQNGQAHFKNFTAIVSEGFLTLYIKELIKPHIETPDLWMCNSKFTILLVTWSGKA